MTFGINGAELIILIILAVLVLGPEKLPEYTRKLTEWIRTLRRMAEGAKVQFKDETGTDFDEIDWRRYDPRQYDPRRIIREALADPVDDPGPDRQGSGPGTGSSAARTPSDTRETLRKDLDTVRSERDALREDLKDMDPRALFFGSSAARRTSPSLSGAYPSAEREKAIVLSRVPEIAEQLADSLVQTVRALRSMELKKSPSISESIDWARTLLALGLDTLDEAAVKDTLGVVLKHASDHDRATTQLKLN
ncbi:MAG: Sec-independent protein translocase TatB [Citricoccus sp.]|nr:Sec-independent protein translocase TatB [Citricoccus sp. WCRC_4]